MRPILFALALLFLAPNASQAATAAEIDSRVDATLARFYQQNPAGQRLAKRAKGVLVFPYVLKAGLGIGGEYGEGSLRIAGGTDGYYATAAASIGLQIGAAMRSQVLLFMTDAALQNFRQADGWVIGRDGQVALGHDAGKPIDNNALKAPIIAFIFDDKGLMDKISLDGAKISRLQR